MRDKRFYKIEGNISCSTMSVEGCPVLDEICGWFIVEEDQPEICSSVGGSSQASTSTSEPVHVEEDIHLHGRNGTQN